MDLSLAQFDGERHVTSSRSARTPANGERRKNSERHARQVFCGKT
jgi:hypothetical protein